MRVEYINPFVETSFRVLQEVLGGAEVKRGDLYLKSTAMPVMGVAALLSRPRLRSATETSALTKKQISRLPLRAHLRARASAILPLRLRTVR